ncbi:sensor histidine kinase [Massilia sp. Dwa41.01b]|uniref:sensor histidine kinase n=1 Tax=Massilia sp. Dwa41.01b TaxID=2709302 RepID=UPI0016024DDC|nr:sensor histidine kinase [Massilia sp. Dwa41.01b]QNA90019.1 sensor histidine kinase [Massilia sp. Dwa41.01b]
MHPYSPDSRPPAVTRYAAAALVASAICATSELVSRWLRGTGDDNLLNPLGIAATQAAAMFTPAPSLLRAGSDRAEMALQLFLGAEALLIGLFVVLLYRASFRKAGAATLFLIVAQMAIGVLLDSLVFGLLATVQLAALLPLRVGLAWLAAQFSAGFAADVLLLLHNGAEFSDGTARTVLAVKTFERCMLLLAFGFTWLVRKDRAARLQLAASHAQLQATQSLLAETVRASERMRIARDLHDSVGHHLTALNLHLDLGLRQAGEGASASLRTSRELARSLLSEVRGVVGMERQVRQIDVGEALRLLCAGIPAPRIEPRVDAGVEACSPSVAHALFCCVQEAVTNTVRHAQASRLVIDIALRGGEVLATIADDGKGSIASEGNGLTGMRERVAELGGRLHVETARGQGFRLAIALPEQMAPTLASMAAPAGEPA